MSTTTEYHTVKLPDGKLAIEVEYNCWGASETHMTYSYYRDGEPLPKVEFKTDYWGRIQGLFVVKSRHGDEVTPDEIARALSRRLT